MNKIAIIALDRLPDPWFIFNGVKLYLSKPRGATIITIFVGQDGANFSTKMLLKLIEVKISKRLQACYFDD